MQFTCHSLSQSATQLIGTRTENNQKILATGSTPHSPASMAWTVWKKSRLREQLEIELTKEIVFLQRNTRTAVERFYCVTRNFSPANMLPQNDRGNSSVAELARTRARDQEDSPQPIGDRRREVHGCLAAPDNQVVTEHLIYLQPMRIVLYSLFGMTIKTKSMMRRRVNRARPSGLVCP